MKKSKTAKKSPTQSAKSTKKAATPKKMMAAKDKGAKVDRNDVIDLIMRDHVELKRLIKIMKDDEKSLSARQTAFEEFGPLLVSHAHPEEETLYAAMKESDELRKEALEGDVEHGLADQMLEEAKRAKDEDLWSAKVKVLAELVEHHIEEEEEELLPDYRKESSPEERRELGTKFLQLKEKWAEQLLENGGDEAPREELLEPERHIHA